jgi:hypothetical protein
MNSIRLLLAALAVSGITFAASGKPLPFLAKAHAPAGNPVLLPPAGVDGPTPGEMLVLDRTGDLIRS